MKLNSKCLVSVLEAVEEASSYYNSFQYLTSEPAAGKLRKYSHDEILYHVNYCHELGYLQNCSILGNGAMITVSDLTPAGHAYLKQHRSNSAGAMLKNAIKEEQKNGIRSAVKLFLKTLFQLITFFR